MNNTLKLLHNHTSIRSYTNQPLTQEQREEIFKAANQHHHSVFCRPFLLLELQIQIFEER